MKISTHSFVAYLILAHSVCLLASCISIEKRRYREGYNVQWKSRPPRDVILRSEKPQELDSLTLSEPQAAAVGVSEGCTAKPVLVEKEIPVIVPSRASVDTLPEKKKETVGGPRTDKEKAVKATERDYKPIWTVLALLGYFFSFILLAGAVYVIVLGIVGLIIVISKNSTASVNKSGKKIPGLVHFGILLGIFSAALSMARYGTALAYLPLLGAFSIMAGIVVFIVAIKKIKGNRDIYRGMGWAVTGLALNIMYIVLMIAFYALLYALLG